MRRIVIVSLLCALVLSLSALAYAANVGDSLVFGARVTGDVAGVPVLNPWFTFVGGIGGNTGQLTLPDAPAATNGLFFSPNVPLIGIRTCTFSVALPTTGTYQVFEAFAATGWAKNNVKHVITYADGATAEAYTDQTAAGGNVDKWISLGTYNFSSEQNAIVQYTNDNQSSSGGLYIHSIKYVLTSLPTPTVPEPVSMLALGTGLIGLFGLIRRKKA